MYQPKIRDDLIQRLYHLAKAQGMPMTRLVNQLLTEGIAQLAVDASAINDPPAGDYTRRQRKRRTT